MVPNPFKATMRITKWVHSRANGSCIWSLAYIYIRTSMVSLIYNTPRHCENRPVLSKDNMEAIDYDGLCLVLAPR